MLAMETDVQRHLCPKEKCALTATQPSGNHKWDSIHEPVMEVTEMILAKFSRLCLVICRVTVAGFFLGYRFFSP